MKTILIIGASRGLGRQFVEHHRATGDTVIATVRRPADAGALDALGAQTVVLDVCQAVDFARLAQSLPKGGIDLCIYNAGVLGPKNTGAMPCDTAEFDAVMHTNVLGALHAVQAFAPAVARRRGKFAFISSRMGSISLQTSAARVTYRASKAALNAVAKTAAIEWAPQGVTVVALHPGWVKTDMGGAEADIDVATSIAGMAALLERIGPDANGRFYDYTGAELTF